MTARTKSNSEALNPNGRDALLRLGAPPLTSATALLGLNAVETHVRILRTWFDAAHHLLRMQQDAALGLARTQLAGRKETAPDAASALTQAMESTSHA